TRTVALSLAWAQITWWQSTVGYDGSPPLHAAPAAAIAAAWAKIRLGRAGVTDDRSSGARRTAGSWEDRGRRRARGSEKRDEERTPGPPLARIGGSARRARRLDGLAPAPGARGEEARPLAPARRGAGALAAHLRGPAHLPQPLRDHARPHH